MVFGIYLYLATENQELYVINFKQPVDVFWNVMKINLNGNLVPWLRVITWINRWGYDIHLLLLLCPAWQQLPRWKTEFGDVMGKFHVTLVWFRHDLFLITINQVSSNGNLFLIQDDSVLMRHSRGMFRHARPSGQHALGNTRVFHN